MNMEEQYSDSGSTKIFLHPHPDIHMYKVTEDELKNATNGDDERTYKDRQTFSAGVIIPCVIDMAVCLYNDNKAWVVYLIVIIASGFVYCFSLRDYKSAKSKRIETLNKIMNNRRVNLGVKVNEK